MHYKTDINAPLQSQTYCAAFFFFVLILFMKFTEIMLLNTTHRQIYISIFIFISILLVLKV